MKKMSRSIKDYKDAVDSIRISESFYKRTETLLNELPEAKIEKRPFYMSRKITAGVMAAAACIICIIGIRTVLDIREDNIESVSEGETALVQQMTSEAAESTVPELIDILEEDDAVAEMFAEDEIDFAFDEDTEEENDEAAAVSAETLISSTGGTSVAAVPDKPAPASGNSSGTGNTVPTEGGGSAGTGNSSSVTTSAAEKTESQTHSESVHDTTAQDIIMLDDVSFEHVTVEITAYFDMDDIKSGETSVKLSGTECRELIESIREMSDSSHKIPNSSFKSLFSLNITDENIGVTFYSIYITDQNTMIITRHDPDGQKRVTYGLIYGKYKELKHTLFLMFGTETDYELFENLISGK